ncbi:hypothetical protein P4O66_020782, partial [Electrophorus voltai]
REEVREEEREEERDKEREEVRGGEREEVREGGVNGSCYSATLQSVLVRVCQVIQVLRAVDRDQTSHSSLIHFSLPSDGRLTLNLTLRQGGGHTASLILLSPMKLLPHLTSSSHTLKIPIILRDGMSELSSTGTVTVATCPCRGGGHEDGGEEEREQHGPPGGVGEAGGVCAPQPGGRPAGPQLTGRAGCPGILIRPAR